MRHNLNWNGVQHGQLQERPDHKALVWEKSGVVAGFLAGLWAGVHWVEAPLTQAHLPRVLVVVATVLTVAMVMRAGASIGSRLALHLSPARR